MRSIPILLFVFAYILSARTQVASPGCVFGPDHFAKNNKYINHKAWITGGCPKTLGDLEDEPFMSTGFNRFHFLELDLSVLRKGSSWASQANAFMEGETVQKADCVRAGQIAIATGNNRCMGIAFTEEIVAALAEFEYLFAAQCMPDLMPVRPFSEDFRNVTRLFDNFNKGKHPGFRACTDVETVRFLSKLDAGHAPPLSGLLPFPKGGKIGVGNLGDSDFDDVDVNSSDVNKWNAGYNLSIASIVLAAIGIITVIICACATAAFLIAYNNDSVSKIIQKDTSASGETESVNTRFINAQQKKLY